MLSEAKHLLPKKFLRNVSFVERAQQKAQQQYGCLRLVLLVLTAQLVLFYQGAHPR